MSTSETNGAPPTSADVTKEAGAAVRNTITINIHATMPSDDQLAALLLRHMRELGASCEEAGWQAELTLTLVKEKPHD